MISLPSKKRQSTILLFLDKTDLIASHYRLEGQSVVRKSISSIRLDDAPERLSTDALAEAVSQLLQQLNAGSREVCLVFASDRIFSFQLDIPKLDKEDLTGFIELEAEQRLPYPISDIHLARIETPAESETRSLIMAQRKSAVTTMAQAIKSAGFQLASVTLDLSGIVEPEMSRRSGECLLIRSADNLTLAIQKSGSLIGLRHFPVNPGMEDLQPLVRDIRISMAQLPPDVRLAMKKIRSISLPNSGDTLGSTISLKGIEACGLEYLGEDKSDELFDSIAEDFISSGVSRIDFLPPRPNKLEKIIQRFDSRRNFWITSAAAAIVVITGLAFFIHNKQLDGLTAKWSAISPKVKELEKIQGYLREFRSWYSDDVPTLTAMKAVVQAFPDTGEIWLKSLSLRGENTIRCSGSAQYQSALLKVMDNLRATPGVQELELQQQQGNNPIFFSIEFIWTPGATPAPEKDNADNKIPESNLNKSTGAASSSDQVTATRSQLSTETTHEI